jgi:hypothetical protein
MSQVSRNDTVRLCMTQVDDECLCACSSRSMGCCAPAFSAGPVSWTAVRGCGEAINELGSGFDDQETQLGLSHLHRLSRLWRRGPTEVGRDSVGAQRFVPVPNTLYIGNGTGNGRVGSLGGRAEAEAIASEWEGRGGKPPRLQRKQASALHRGPVRDAMKKLVIAASEELRLPALGLGLGPCAVVGFKLPVVPEPLDRGDPGRDLVGRRNGQAAWCTVVGDREREAGWPP